MIRVSTVVFGSVVAAVVALTGCRVSVETKNRVIEENVQATAVPWNGEDIVINADGVGVSVNGGLDVVADSVSEVSASARILAMAFSNEKANADLSIAEAKATFKITSSGGVITVACGHGGSHGSSNSGESGCEKMVVKVPAGTATQKLKIKALSGNGSVNLDFSNATITSLEANGQGDIDARIPATAGATVSIVAEKADDIIGRLPSDFAADDIQLVADAESIQNDFTDAKLGQGAGGRGTAGSGLASLKLSSKEFAGSTGKVTLTRR
jgi:hypothetical protein